ncbi:AOC03_06830 family ribosome hibernation factor [Perlabentimonas gracilis]|uniref:AOC03_06830 family ribosome hibernation factor n=1 Tax=Perlabentimonas gracilis TaxID=2715279 RepID=UPI00140C75C0|nr:hypothetical protein [Perlabentimonas gracilis]NHB68505.1 hypothetical protein [Perlabentimonas gracilis]
MNDFLKKYKDVKAEGCVSLILNTHRTKPDNQKDAITLKNMIKDAEVRLLKEMDKKLATKLINRINDVAKSIDHSHNLESLVIFVNYEVADYTRLPVAVADRVIIEDNFATRDLIRAMHQEAGYYIVVISRQKARLLEAFNDKVVAEIKDDFPIENNLYATDKVKLSTAKGQDNLTEEFFNRVDKAVLKAIKQNPMHVLLATETRNFEHYKKIADKPELIIGHINRNRDDEEPQHIIPDAWAEVKKIIKQKNELRLAEVDNAISQGKLLTDINQIWKAVNEGRGQTLFVKKGYFQPAIIEQGNVKPVDEKMTGVTIDDIVDEMIEVNLSYGGDTVFFEKDLATLKNIGLIQRY